MCVVILLLQQVVHKEVRACLCVVKRWRRREKKCVVLSLCGQHWYFSRRYHTAANKAPRSDWKVPRELGGARRVLPSAKTLDARAKRPVVRVMYIVCEGSMKY